MVDLIVASALVMALGGVATLFALARPARCPRCGDRAVSAEERELASAPPVIAYVERCPRCWDVVAHRTVGACPD
jgi:hypothetical protein